MIRRPATARRAPKKARDVTQRRLAESDEVRALALQAVAAALDKKAEYPVVLDVRTISGYADYVVLLSAESERQVDAIARAIEERLRSQGSRLRGLEGAGGSNWLLMDFGDLVVHVFFQGAREFYDLEGLWTDAPRVRIPPA